MSREQTECGETQLDQAGRKIRRESAFDRWKDASLHQADVAFLGQVEELQASHGRGSHAKSIL